MSVTRIATCTCSLITIQCTGEPVRTSVCHCLECQKRTGSVFGAQARFATQNTVLDGAVSSYTRTADSGNQVSYDFCPRCGTTMRLRLSAAPGYDIVPLGIFEENDLPAPDFSIYEARKKDWVTFEGEMDHFQ